MPVTIYEVASRAAVSPSTVSRAFTVPDLVRKDTLQRVLGVAKELGYQPNRAARALITGKTGNLGVIVPDIGNPFFASMLKGTSVRARDSDSVLFLADTDEDPAMEEKLLRAMAPQVDGLVLCGSRLPEARLTELLVDGLLSDVPVVLVNRTVGEAACVVMDIADGMRQAVEHLAALGHRTVAYVSGPATSWSNGQRLRGLLPAARAAGVEVVQLGPFAPRFPGGLQAADLVLASDATAVLAFNDLVALGVLSRLAVRGVRVPEELSVIGCDDIPMSAMGAPPLTTVAMPTEAAGRAAVDLLLRQIEGPVPRARRPASPGAGPDPAGLHQALPTSLLIRSSTLPPAGGSAVPARRAAATTAPRERN